MIENNILAISNEMFKNKADWTKVTKDQKEQFFFIFNRYFSKMYPTKAQQLNNKLIDKSTGMDLWFEFMKTKPYPQWFWGKKSSDSKSKEEFSDKEIDLLSKSFDLKNEEIDFLIKHHKDEIIEELKYLKSLNK